MPAHNAGEVSVKVNLDASQFRREIRRARRELLGLDVRLTIQSAYFWRGLVVGALAAFAALLALWGSL